MADKPEIAEVEVESAGELRDWLAANHGQAESVWLVVYKKHAPHYLSMGQIIDELLCWGWVDSRSRGVDARRTSVLIAPRSPASAWSAVNKEKIARLRQERRMQPAGEATIAAAKANGMWSFLDDVERLEVPEDLAAALGDLRKVWEDYPRSIRRAALEWIKTAKTAPTREKRIADVAHSASEGLRPTPFRR